MDSIDKIFRRMVPNRIAGATVIVCLFTGPAFPSRCAAMSRQPAPETGMPFDSRFSEIFAEATMQNPAIHDGAVMIGRRSVSEHYEILGWSFRLFPDAQVIDGPANRGSAFNSAHAMSRVPTVDAVYWVSGNDIYRFCDGAAYEVSRAR